jgi:hypothetical protein
MKILRNQLIREYYQLESQKGMRKYLTEQEIRDTEQNGTMYLVGIIQASDTVNGNGRIYPHAILEREINNYQKLVREARATGELDHPDSDQITLANVSHLMTGVWWDKENPHLVMGKVKVLETPAGQTLRKLVEGGVKVGISSRAVGSVLQTSGGLMVEDDLGLICFDMVSTPSTPEAYMLREAKNYTPRQFFSKADRINRILNELRGNHG